MSKDFKSAFSNVIKDRTVNDKEKIAELQKQLENNSTLVQEIELDKIKLVENIRKANYDTEQLQENLKTNGQFVPVILTKDFYLLDGFRRFFALKEIGEKTIKVSILDIEYSKIEHLFHEYQYFINEERKNLDNLDLAYFYSSYSENKGLTLEEIAKIFNKTKGFISKVISLKNISQPLQDYIRDFQEFAYSKKKFHALNISQKALNKDFKTTDNFYIQNKGKFIGISTLYKIAIIKDELEQFKMFFELFKDRLTEDEKQDFLEDLEGVEIEGQKKESKENPGVFSIIFNEIKSQVKKQNLSKEKQKKINKKLKELKEIIDSEE